jgi:hypothetical protein
MNLEPVPAAERRVHFDSAEACTQLIRTSLQLRPASRAMEGW